MDKLGLRKNDAYKRLNIPEQDSYIDHAETDEADYNKYNEVDGIYGLNKENKKEYDKI